MKCTIYKNVFDYLSPKTVSVKKALERIKDGASREAVENLRATTDSSKQDAIKKLLPCVVFTGIFTARRDDAIIAGTETNLLVLDFDHVADLTALRQKLMDFESCYACWTSPRGEGLKALIKISAAKKHREHFMAIEKMFPEVDASGKNISRACFESYDPNIYVNEDAVPFATVIEETVITEVINEFTDDATAYNNLKTWLANKSEAFADGNRNNYIYKLAGACCRYGISESSSLDFILRDYANGSFSQHEIKLAVHSSYRANKMGSATFDKNKLVEKSIFSLRTEEVSVEELGAGFEEFSHVIFAEQVETEAANIYDKGYEQLDGINAPVLDYYYKMKRKEVTLFTGFGNMGKSTLLLWLLLNRAVLYDEKFAIYSPESVPAEEFYLELVEMLAGCDCSANNPARPPKEQFLQFYKFVGEHFFFVYPEKTQPTTTTIKEAFLELIIKHNVDGVVIDPFNQIHHERKGVQREDFYLEEVLADFTKFAQQNNVFFQIVAHPTSSVERNEDGDFKAPDMYKISGGAMWANKMHNIAIYHRPYSRSQPLNPIFTFTMDKVKKKKSVGKTGSFEAHYILEERRFKLPYWTSATYSYDLNTVYDPLKKNIERTGLFKSPKKELPFGDINTAFQ